MTEAELEKINEILAKPNGNLLLAHRRLQHPQVVPEQAARLQRWHKHPGRLTFIDAFSSSPTISTLR